MGEVVYLFTKPDGESCERVIGAPDTYRRAFTEAVRPLFHHDVLTLLRHPDEERTAIINHYAARMTERMNLRNPNKDVVKAHASIKLHRAFHHCAENINRMAPQILRNDWRKDITDMVLDCASIASAPAFL